MNMFNPKYTITNTLATNMRKVGELIGELNSKAFEGTVFLNLENDARALSSFSSTRIEGNPLSLTDVKKILKSTPQHIRDTEREVLNYNKALTLLDKKIKLNEKIQITNNFICEIQGLVVDRLVVKSYQGKYRSEPIFVNDPIKRETVYLPPDDKDVLFLMTELIDFINSKQEEIDPIILAGLFHKQFVIVHPFIDGNGRATRLITKTILAKLGINTFPLFSFENYYNNNITKYFQTVGVFGNYYELADKVDFTQWLEFFADGIIDELNRIKGQLPQYQARLEPHHKQILDYIKENGSIAAREYAKITGRAKATRIKDFKKLTQMDLIKTIGVGKATYYVLNTH